MFTPATTATVRDQLDTLLSHNYMRLVFIALRVTVHDSGVSLHIRAMEAVGSLWSIPALGGTVYGFSSLLVLPQQRRQGVVVLSTAEDVAIYAADVKAGNVRPNES
jgi:hypothetical protein